MQHTSSTPITGFVRLHPGLLRTLYSSAFRVGRYERIGFPECLPEDERAIQAACEPLRQLFPFLDWEQWRVEVVNDHHVVACLHFEERTLQLDRRALATPLLLAWDTYFVFLQAHLLEVTEDELTSFQRRCCAFHAILHCFAEERRNKQEEFLNELHLFADNNADVQRLFQELYLAPIPSMPLSCTPNRLSVRETEVLDSSELARRAVTFLKAEEDDDETVEKCMEQWPELLSSVQKHVALQSLFSWRVFCSPLYSILSEFVRKIEISDSSTTRRLTLFRLCVERALEWNPPRFQGLMWPLLSLAALDAGRHPRIHQALQQYIELQLDDLTMPLKCVPCNRGQLVRLAIQNNLSEQDDRFFRQATHVQSIWRDILHRSASQSWASRLLFDALEKSVYFAHRDPNLFFAAVMRYEDERFDRKGEASEPEIQNLHELLWVLSQSSASVVRRLFPRDEEEAEKAQERWPLVRTHLKHFLHLAPSALQRLLQQVEDETDERHRPEKEPFAHVELDADPEIPHQELHGRILPLLSRPGVLDEYAGLSLDEIFQMRVIELNRFLPKSCGNWQEERLSSCFLIQFKTIDNYWRGNWSETALWIEKELDLNKVKGRKDAPPTFDSLLHQDGIWQRTYRYQFSSLDHLLRRLKPNAEEWTALLDCLTHEYLPLFTLQLRLVLDYHYYLARWQRFGDKALFNHVLNDLDAPMFLQWSPEEFEQIKTSLADQIAEEGLASFRNALHSDHRSWSHATTALQECLDSLEQLFHLPPGALFEEETPEVHEFQSLCCDVMRYGVEQIDEFDEGELPWDQDKLALLEQLQIVNPTGAQLFARFLLEQLTPDLHVVELLCHNIDELAEVRTYHPIVQMRGRRSNEMTSYLRSNDGQLLPPDFLPFVTRVPVELLREVIEEDPTFYQTLKRAAQWLRRLASDHEEVLAFWATLAELKPTSSPVPPPEETVASPHDSSSSEEPLPCPESEHPSHLN